MAAYSRTHYGPGYAAWRLRPRAIVEHYTAGGSFSSAWYTFAGNRPDPELGQLPGTCAHFVIDTDGTIYQLVPTNVRCRHTVGLNHVAIGIEHVGTSDAQVLGNRRQLTASLRLTRWLMSTNGIALRNVIGHNESLSSPFHRELYRPWATQTHGDFTRASMDVYRRRLAAAR
jgi:N-acetyl-anhydromuramyl-L-alanine amidase AmpD